jgi:hypothetical protein
MIHRNPLWPNLMMLGGAAIWLTGELWGVTRDLVEHYHGLPDTTSGWVWTLEHKWPFLRIIVCVLLLILALHFVIHHYTAAAS